MNNDTDNYDKRVRKYEAEGLTRSDAQGVVDAEDMKAARTMNITPGPWTITVKDDTDIVISGPFSKGKHGGKVADLICTVSCGLNNTQSANARAISLVPEMIEALKTLYEMGVHQRTISEGKLVGNAYAKAANILKQIEG